MTPKELVLNTLMGKKSKDIPAGLNGLGSYKYAIAEIVSEHYNQEEIECVNGKKLAEIESNFQETFQPDFMHVTEAFYNSKKQTINDPEYNELLSAVRSLESKTAIDEFLDLVYDDAETLIEQKKFDHLKLLIQEYGDEIFIFLETKGPMHDLLDKDGILGFEKGMFYLNNKPKMFTYLVEGMFCHQLEYVRAVHRCGLPAYCQSESYFSSDLVPPKTYITNLLPIHKWFYEEVSNFGLIPLMNFHGNIAPIISYIAQTNIRGLLIDESRKEYTLDVAEIKNGLGTDIALFGNVSSKETLLKGTTEEVEKEVITQIEKAGKDGGFLSCCGSGICFGTPAENIKTLIYSAKYYLHKRYENNSIAAKA